MALSIEIQKKPNVEKQRKVCKASEVFELEEVQEIKDAIQEHFLFIGLDTKNNIRNISLLGVGKSNGVEVDMKYVVRTALVTASDKVILVHNHPSNQVEPSFKDRDYTNIINELLKAYSVHLLDHVIVGKDKYLSMAETKEINRKDKINEALLLEENYRLKGKIRKLTNEIKQYKKIEKQEEEEYE